jgi:23S rRNA pseudouridine2605 synthase
MARQRLQKAMAAAGIASRRGGEELIKAGRVTIDGRTAILGEQVDPDTQQIAVDGRPVPPVDTPRSYWLLNKPAGYVSTVRDRHATRTVMELLPRDVVRQTRLYPVGRLDEESEGLLLLTNDGAWAELLLHPRYGVEREYMVGLDRSLSREQKRTLLEGLELEEGLARVDMLELATPAQVRNLNLLLEPPHAEQRWYRVVLAQGWKRQIRRMFDGVGAPVARLARVRVGTLKLVDLGPGQVRQLARQEVSQLASTARRTTTTRPRRQTPPNRPNEASEPKGRPSGTVSSDR